MLQLLHAVQLPYRHGVFNFADAVEALIKFPDGYNPTVCLLLKIEADKASTSVYFCDDAVVSSKTVFLCVNCAPKVCGADCLEIMIELIWVV